LLVVAVALFFLVPGVLMVLLPDIGNAGFFLCTLPGLALLAWVFKRLRIT